MHAGTATGVGSLRGVSNLSVAVLDGKMYMKYGPEIYTQLKHDTVENVIYSFSLCDNIM